MKHGLVLKMALALAALSAALPGPATAGERWPDVPVELGVAPIGRDGLMPYRCSETPVNNFYHDAVYHEPPAVYLGFAYRPYYRYRATRMVPRIYSCSER